MPSKNILNFVALHGNAWDEEKTKSGVTMPLKSHGEATRLFSSLMINVRQKLTAAYGDKFDDGLYNELVGDDILCVNRDEAARISTRPDVKKERRQEAR